MEKKFATLDDLMNNVLQILVQAPFNIKASKGTISEIVGSTLILENPLARLSKTETRGKPFSAIGELLWYLSASDSLDFINYYIPNYKKFSDDGLTIHGAYGPRLFKMHKNFNQIKNVILLLKRKNTSRQATIQIFDAMDLARDYKDIPCTCTLQFLVRLGRLDMITYMRSNDAFWGLPHDIFSFTMIQEIVARSLNVELGVYRHIVGSLHLYKDKLGYAEQYLSEGLQTHKNPMPEMPHSDPWDSISKLIKIEEKLRCSSDLSLMDLTLDNYWLDISLMLYIHTLFKENKMGTIQHLAETMKSSFYYPYIAQRFKSSNEKHT